MICSLRELVQTLGREFRAEARLLGAAERNVRQHLQCLLTQTVPASNGFATS